MVKRKAYYPLSEILSQIKKILRSEQRIDYITFSGSGEPTLNSAIGKLIKEIKKITTIPVAVLTNSSLLSFKSVREALRAADLVVPSLDAATQEIFVKINRSDPEIKIEKIIEGLKKFRQEFKAKIWLETMLVKGVNDSPTHLRKLKEVIEEINPDKIQLNTVVRPPAEKFARSLSLEDLERARKILGEKCEIIAEFGEKEQRAPSENLESVLFSMIQRRPVTLSDMANSVGKHKNEIIKYLNFLLEKGKIKVMVYKGKKYYESG